MSVPEFDSYQHPSYAAYRRGCRCELCCTYQRERVAKNRADRLASGRLTHGKRSSYDAGCRCDECAAVKRLATAREAEMRRAARIRRGRAEL